MTNDELHTDAAAQCQGAANWLKSERRELPITHSDGQTAKLVGDLYYQGSYHNKTLLLALHGGSYNHTYWNAPVINDHDYSFACYMARQHYAVLALDSLGAGESSGQGTLDGDFITISEVKQAVLQATNQLRHGCGFSKLVFVGHSIGSETLLGLQASNHPADALVLTGWGHTPPPSGSPVDPSLFAALAQDPYAVVPASVRGLMFFGPTADPDMVIYDATHLADVLPRGVLLTGFGMIYQPALTGANQVTGKVLVQLGENDILFPAVTAASEPAAYPLAQLTVQTQPAAGHSFNLHRENGTGWALMARWLQENHFDRP